MVRVALTFILLTNTTELPAGTETGWSVSGADLPNSPMPRPQSPV